MQYVCVNIKRVVLFQHGCGALTEAMITTRDHDCILASAKISAGLFALLTSIQFYEKN